MQNKFDQMRVDFRNEGNQMIDQLTSQLNKKKESNWSKVLNRFRLIVTKKKKER